MVGFPLTQNSYSSINENNEEYEDANMKAYDEEFESFNTGKNKMIKKSFKFTVKKGLSRMTNVKMSGSNNEMMQSHTQKDG